MNGIPLKRVTLFAGHYGSGKTNIALNFARETRRVAAAENRETVIADLDIVNPYFRTQDSAGRLAAEGIRLVVSGFANSNVDFPAMPKEAYSLFSRPSGPLATAPYVICDVGGDDRGALALGRYVPDILAEGDYEMLAVINASRPLTRMPDDAFAVLGEIESAAGLRFTGLVNNTNLGQETRAEDVLASLPYAEQVAALTGLPIRFTCCTGNLVPALEGRVGNLFPLSIQKLYYQLDCS